MPMVSHEQLVALQGNANGIRNICVLAHVDHGKTTLSDSLIASNGVISPKLAGKVRYMDSLPSEQERFITMKSSAISLLYQPSQSEPSQSSGESSDSIAVKPDPILVNLIDSPGHVDFSSEVSSAVRLSDGALILVDAVESVCIQTHAVLHQAWKEGLRPCLVINKVDRLITELHLTPIEAYSYMRRTVERVNVIMSHFWKEEGMSLLSGGKSGKDVQGNETDEMAHDSSVFDLDIHDEDDSEVYFSPDKGNVIFTSATDCWGFSIDTFANQISKKLGMSQSILRKTLWGDYYFRAKEKKVVPARLMKAKDKPMFVQFVLENVWAVYEAVKNRNQEKIAKIVQSLNLKINPRELKTRDTAGLIRTIMSKWMPLSCSLLQMVADVVPSPVAAQRLRIPRFWPQIMETEGLSQALLNCQSGPEAPCVVFVSKIFRVPRMDVTTSNNAAESQDPVAMARARVRDFDRAQAARRKQEVLALRQQRQEQGVTNDAASIGESADTALDKVPQETSSEIFVGFARIFSGTLVEGQTVHVLGPRYDPSHPDAHATVMTVTQLYLMMGRAMEKVARVPAGNILGIGGEISDHVLKTATLTSTLECPSFPLVDPGVKPAIRVALEPENVFEMPKLEAGLRLLVKADPGVESYVQETGEHVIAVAGEVHLDRCLRDLRDSYARIPIQVSPPIVNFRETLLPNKTKPVSVTTPDKLFTVTMTAVALPDALTRFLEMNTDLIRSAFLFGDVSLKQKECQTVEAKEQIQSFLSQLSRLAAAEGTFWEESYGKLWGFGPRRVGACWLVSDMDGFVPTSSFHQRFSQESESQPVVSTTSSLQTAIDELLTSPDIRIENDNGESEDVTTVVPAPDLAHVASSSAFRPLAGPLRDGIVRRLENAIVTGFQAAVAAGPLCEEPMSGVAFFVKHVDVFSPNPNETVSDSSTWDSDQLDTAIASFVAINDNNGPITGQVISSVKDACRESFELGSMRLRESVYLCEIQAADSVLGKVYGVLSKRRSRVIHEEMKEGTALFTIRAILPVVEAFGFTQELRSKTSGAANPQLVLSHWETIPLDPYYKPTTEEEVVEWGDNDRRRNVAREYMDMMRKRKGLLTQDKIVIHAEKQRTISKNV